MLSKKITLRNLQKGLTSIDVISITVMAVTLLIILAFWFSSYKTNSKIAETQVFLRQIFDAEVAYYKNSQPNISPSPRTSKMNSNRKVFLPLSPQPANPTSKPQYGNFTQGDWAILNIKHEGPVYYSYSVETSGIGINATFSVIARGDLDGDQKYSRYEMVGRVNPNEQIQGKDIIYSLDPLE